MRAYRELDRQITELAAQIALACKLGQSKRQITRLIQDGSTRLSRTIIAILARKLSDFDIDANAVLAFSPPNPPISCN